MLLTFEAGERWESGLRRIDEIFVAECFIAAGFVSAGYVCYEGDV